jgi:peptidyl-prolyl cis-trans isomerase D
MLEYLRKHSSSIVVKALMFLLVLSFAAWGIGDYIRRGAEDLPLATVGDVRISQAQYDYEFQGEINRLRAVLGPQFGREQARALGLPESLMNRLVTEALFDLGAKDLGITVSDAVLRSTIEANPTFRGPLGAFDRGRFQQVLQNVGMTESRYIALLRSELARQQLLMSVDPGKLAPSPLVQALFRERNEKRTFAYVAFEDQAIPEPAAPDEAALAKFHQDRAQDFTAPEYRALTVLSFTVDELAKEIKVSDAELQEAYEARASEFQTPERRALQQILLADEAKAKQAYELLREGRDFATVAKDVAGMAPDAVNIGTLAKNQLLSELADPVFAAKEGDVTTALKSPLGWHLVRVVKIEPASHQTLDQARDALTKAVAREKAIDGLVALANRVEDALGGGAKLEEAAARFNLKITKISAIDPRGLDPSGKPVDGLPPGESFLAVAFETPEGSDSPLTDTGEDGYFLIHVDKVTPPTLKPLAQVRDQVVAAWRAQERAAAAQKKAEALAEKLRAGGDFKALAAEAGATARDSGALTRRGGGGLPAPLIEAVFKLKPGDTTVARGDKVWYVARLTHVEQPDPAADKSGVDALASQISQSIQSDLNAQLAGALRKQHAVSVNRASLERLAQ